MLDFLATVRPEGWVGAGCALLEMSGDARVRFQSQIAADPTRADYAGLHNAERSATPTLSRHF